MPYLKIKVPQLIWWSGACRFHLWMLDIQMSSRDLTTWQGTRIYRIMHKLPWIMIFGHKWGDLPMIFIIDKVTSENYWQITSMVTKKLLFMLMDVLVYFLHPILSCLCSEPTILLKIIINRSLCYCRSIVTYHCDVSTVDLWHHTNKHCDIIFVDCSCMCKLAQWGSSLVNNNNNNSEYRFPTTRYSPLSM